MEGLKRHDVPKDILVMLECDAGELDEMVHEMKGQEATAINNGGYWEQLDALRSGNWASWDAIRKHLKGEDPHDG